MCITELGANGLGGKVIADGMLRDAKTRQERRGSNPAPNGLELSCPAEAGSSSLLYGTPAGQASST